MNLDEIMCPLLWFELGRPPSKINDFLYELFELNEIRGKGFNVEGINFIIHTDEKNHNIPHVHVEYGEFSMSISLNDFTILACNNFPKRKQRIAIDFVRKHREELLCDWKDIAISQKMNMHKSIMQ